MSRRLAALLFLFLSGCAVGDITYTPSGVSLTNVIGLDLEAANVALLCTVQASSSGSAITKVSCYIQDPNSVAYGCSSDSPVSGNSYVCTVTVPQGAEPGAYVLREVSVAMADGSWVDKTRQQLNDEGIGLYANTVLTLVNAGTVETPTLWNMTVDTVPDPLVPGQPGLVYCRPQEDPYENLVDRMSCAFRSPSSPNVTRSCSSINTGECVIAVDAADEQGQWNVQAVTLVAENRTRLDLDYQDVIDTGGEAEYFLGGGGASGGAPLEESCTSRTVDTTATNQVTDAGAQTATSMEVLFRFLARASGSGGHILVGDGAISAVSDAAVAVRFNSSNEFDVYSDTGYVADGTAAWVADTWYRVEMRVDYTRNVFDAWAGLCGGSLTKIAEDRPFRSTVTPGTNLNRYGVHAPTGVTVDLSEFDTESVSWDTRYLTESSCGCKPQSCKEQAVTCGTTSDQCGGTLTCGDACP